MRPEPNCSAPSTGTNWFLCLAKNVCAKPISRYITLIWGRLWFTDPVYYSYREAFLQLARQADCETVNCSEGGILFGDGLQFQPFAEFLRNQA